MISGGGVAMTYVCCRGCKSILTVPLSITNLDFIDDGPELAIWVRRLLTRESKIFEPQVHRQPFW